MLPVDKFSPSKVIKDGYENKCRDCRQQARKKHKIECNRCGVEFLSPKKSTLFCSTKCAGESRKRRKIVNCPVCGKDFEVQEYRTKTQTNVFCSRDCFSEYLSNSLQGENNQNFNRITVECFHCGKGIERTQSSLSKSKHYFCDMDCYKEGIGKTKVGSLNPNYIRVKCDCKNCGKVFERKPSEIRGDTFCSRVCNLQFQNRSRERAEVVGVTCENCGKSFERSKNLVDKAEAHYCSVECKDAHYMRTYKSGENNPNYNPSKSLEERIKDRNYPEYVQWRLDVYKRDDFTCQVCGDNRGGNLIAHHLFNYAKYPKLRTEISNGVTLCEKCHSEFHKMFGFYNNTKEQFEKFKSNKLTMSEASPETVGTCND